MTTRINKDYQYTKVWDSLEDVCLESGSLYIYIHDPEERSMYCAQQLRKKNINTIFLELSFSPEDDSVNELGNESKKILLNSSTHIGLFLNKYKSKVVYLEVTGMSCRVAAPILKYAILNGILVQVIYTEPKSYKINMFNNGFNKDLCETVKGINPLPGFTNILPNDISPLFVVLLGFEGGRFSYIIQNQTPDNSKIIPILGVPGYRLHYPNISIWNNRNSILTTKSWQNLKCAQANSIVDAYMVLKQISYDNRDPKMVIAPIGTKPHAIGTILYALKNPTKVEILYDNPFRRVNRTDGIGKILVCDVTKLFNEN